MLCVKREDCVVLDGHGSNSKAKIIGSMIAGCPAPTSFRGTTITVKLFSGSGWSMEYSRVVSSTDTVSFSPLVVLVMVTLYPRMGTPSRVKGGLQEMRTVVELMVVTVRLWTAPNRPVEEH